MRSATRLAPGRRSRRAGRQGCVAALRDHDEHSEQLKTLYLVTRSLDPKGTGQERWITGWRPALHAFAITFPDRMPAAQNL
jgi:putative transposase